MSGRQSEHELVPTAPRATPSVEPGPCGPSRCPISPPEPTQAPPRAPGCCPGRSFGEFLNQRSFLLSCCLGRWRIRRVVHLTVVSMCLMIHTPSVDTLCCHVHVFCASIVESRRGANRQVVSQCPFSCLNDGRSCRAHTPEFFMYKSVNVCVGFHTGCT